jgi:cytochrome c-type protein NapB
MKTFPSMALVAAVALVTPALAKDPVVKPLRGTVPPAETNHAVENPAWQRDRDPIPRDYVQQPPLVPHKIEGYVITARDNKCMDCHSWARYKEMGATKVSLTHFRDRGGTELADISPRRYFCTQCHVPQTDAKPLVPNTFKPVQAVRQR